MEKRYQVFVSSTYTDLLEARQEVMQALLESDCIPAGMELFPAADDDQWTLIKRVIDECDYCIVIIAGRYGSVGPEEKSFTQLEYEYAISQGKPVIAFLHEKPGSLPADNTEKAPAQAKKLEDFRNLAKKKMVRYWTTPEGLGSVVGRSLVRLIKSHPATGWVKADSLPSQEATTEILELRKQVDELRHELETVRTTAPKETVPLAQGEDEFKIEYTFRVEDLLGGDTYSESYSVSWSRIFARISPLMIDEASDKVLQNELGRMAEELNIESLRKRRDWKFSHLHLFHITDNAFSTIKVQLLTLKLIIKSTKSRSVKDTANYWTLTPDGETLMTELRAIRKTDSEEPPPRISKRATKSRRTD